MGRGLSDQQKKAIRHIGDDLIRYRWWADRTKGVRYSTDVKTASGWASWARTLRRLEERGLVVRMGWEGSRLTPDGWRIYQQLTGVDVSPMLADHSEGETRREYRATIPDDPVLVAVKILGLSWPFSASDVEAAYRRPVKENHPDVGGSADDFRRINEAYARVAAVV